MVRLRQGPEALREQVLGLDLVGRHGGQFVPGHVSVQLYAHARLHGLSPAAHHDLTGRIRQVIARFQQLLLPVPGSGPS